MKILSFGEILWDVYPENKYIGGAPLNFAAHMAKHGGEVFMLSALGRDILGEEACGWLKKHNISDKYVSFNENKETGKCLVTLDENSVPSYNLLRDVAYDYISSDDVDGNYDVLYFGTLALRSENNFNSVKKLAERDIFGEIFVDVNIRPPFYSEKTVRFAVENATILKISLEELGIIEDIIGTKGEDHKSFAKMLAQKFGRLKCVIITLGSDGAYALDCDTLKEYSCAGRKVNVVSTVGAGDSFSAAFMYSYLNKSDVSACLEYASNVAAFVVSKTEAVPEYEISDIDNGVH